MYTVISKIIARATAFAGTAEEKHFDKEVDDYEVDSVLDDVIGLAKAYEAENQQTALFAQVEQANGKKLTKPQRELLVLTLSLQAGTYAPSEPQSTTPPPTDSKPKDEDEHAADKPEQTSPEATTKESTSEVPSDGVDGGTEEAPEDPEPKEEQSADDLVEQAANDAEKATGGDTDEGVEAALAALGP